MIVIYELRNTANGKVYYGKTKNLAARWWRHQYHARRGHDLPLHRALRKYGPAIFSVTVLSKHETVKSADTEERRLVSTLKRGQGYNVAPGGEGGVTLTRLQIVAQYTIKPIDYDRFKELFRQEITAVKIATLLGVSLRAVRRCAARLSLSFGNRRSEAAKRKQPRKRRSYRSNAKLTATERSVLRSRVATDSNRKRGVDVDTQQEIRRLYFEDHLTACQVAAKLRIRQGSVRATVNKFYDLLPPSERANRKREHGSAVRTGSRNANFRGANRP